MVAYRATLERIVANCAVSAPIAACMLPMVAMRSATLSDGDLGDHIQNSFAPLRCVWYQIVPISIRNDSVRRTPPELVFDQEAIGHELHEVGGARPSRWAGSRFDFNRYETIGSLDEIVGPPNEPISSRDQRANQRPPTVGIL